MSGSAPKEDSKVNKSGIIFFSLVLSTAVSFVVYYLIKWYYNNSEMFSIEKFSLIAAGSFGILIFMVSFLLAHMLSDTARGNNSIKTVGKLQVFNEALISSRTDNEAYMIFLEYLSDIYSGLRINIYYKTGERINDEWMKLGNCKLPICSFRCDSCPTATKKRANKVNDIGKDIGCPFQLEQYRTGSYICLNMTNDANDRAILQMYSSKADYFTEEIIRTINKYVENVMYSIGSKKRVEELNKEAYTDKLTAIKNRKYFDEILPKVLSKSEKLKVKSSLLMLDIDYFKKVNDTYGHQAGDVILTLFAETIQSCLRKIDILCRYGGEEFAVILPSTGEKQAKLIAARIRSTIESEEMPEYGGVKLPSITCSLGISTYPSVTISVEELIKTADIALYEAKTAGRNCVKVYNPERYND